MLDPRGGLLGELLTPFKLGVGGPIAGGRQYMSWIHIDDEVGILLWALDNEKVSGTVNSTAPNPVTNREFSQAIGRALGRPASVPVPGFVLDLKFGGEFGKVLRGGQRVMPRRALDLGYEFRYPEIDGALQELVVGRAGCPLRETPSRARRFEGPSEAAPEPPSRGHSGPPPTAC